MKWTSGAVTFAVVCRFYPWRRYIVVQNVSWGLLPHEADVVALSPAGWLTEIEIKISRSDLARDLNKMKHKRSQFADHDIIRHFYYAMPEIGGDDLVPEGAGIIRVRDDGHCVLERRAKPRASARKLTDSERLQLLRLGCMRPWSMLGRELRRLQCMEGPLPSQDIAETRRQKPSPKPKPNGSRRRENA